jgi:hypothetical protein
MRSQKFVAVAGILVAVALAGLSGCGSSDKASNWTTGDPNDPGFQAVQLGVTAFVDSTLQYLDNGFSAHTTIISSGGTIEPPSFGPINPDSDVVVTTYDDATGWHEIYVTRVALAYGSAWRDSLQFRDTTGTFQQSPTYAAEFSYIHNLGIASHDTSETSFSYTGRGAFEFDGISTNLGTINGTHNWSYWKKLVGDSSTVRQWLNFSSALNDLTFVKNGSVWSEHPTSGSITAAIEYIYQLGETAPVTTSWVVYVEFGETTTVTVTSGTTAWSYTYGE